ncbi:hypothetical protein BaRGS_00035928, partial [Batillaria attramentaria]
MQQQFYYPFHTADTDRRASRPDRPVRGKLRLMISPPSTASRSLSQPARPNKAAS